LAEITAFESTPLMEQVFDQLRGLTPQNNSAAAVTLAGTPDCWRNYTIPLVAARAYPDCAAKPLIPILVFWLIIFFVCFGLISENNQQLLRLCSSVRCRCVEQFF